MFEPVRDPKGSFHTGEQVDRWNPRHARRSTFQSAGVPKEFELLKYVEQNEEGRREERTVNE